LGALRNLRLWASVLISAALLWLALRGQHLPQTIGALRDADYRYLLPALGLYFIGVWVRAARWRVLLSPMGSYSTRSLFPVVVIGYMANDVLPARMGEVVRVYVLSEREGLPKASALGTVVVERLLDAATMLLLLAVAALLVPLNGVVEQVALVAAGVLLVALWPLLFLVLWPDKLLRLVAPFAARLPEGLAGRLSSVAGGFLSGLQVVRSRRVVALGLGLSVLAWLFEAGMYWTLAAGFNLPVGAALMLLTLSVTNLATLVPAAPGYVGSFELGALAVLVGLAGIQRELALGYILALHAALVVPVTLLGFLFWGSHNLSLQRIRREARERHEQRSIRAQSLE
jgi:uncharacterized protein (TIRG00374 family)